MWKGVDPDHLVGENKTKTKFNGNKSDKITSFEPLIAVYRIR